MKGKVKCTCGWSWNKSDSSKKDMYICHECGRDNSNNMRNGGWLDNYGEQENYNDYKVSAPEGMVGDGFSNVGRNYSPAWGGQFENGGLISNAQKGKKVKPLYVESKNDPRYKAYQDSLSLYNQSIALKEKLKPYFNTDAIKNKDKVLNILDNSSVYRNYDKTKNKPTVSPINVSWSTGSPLLINASGRMTNNSNMPMASYPIYKKPTQAVEVQVVKKPNTTKNEIYYKEPVHREITQEEFDRINKKTKSPFVNIKGVYSNDVGEYYKISKKKPQQPVIVKPKEVKHREDLIPLQPMSVGLQDVDNGFKTNLDIPTPVQRQPKYYDVRDVNNQYGGGDTQYRVDSLDELRELPKELWDRKITPQYQMGGNIYPVNYVPQAKGGMSMPGSVGFTYARTQGIPSKGPRRNQVDVTDASAQNGKEMQYYREGLDWKPKGMKDGGWLSKYDKAQDGDLLDKWRADHPTVRSFINDTQNRKIQAYKGKGKGKETNIIQKDNVKTATPKIGKIATAKEKEQRAIEQNKLAQQQSEQQAAKDWVQGSMEEAYKSPLMSPGYFTPEGAAIGAMQGATKMGPDLYEGDYKAAAMDALMMLPIAIPAAKTLRNIKNINPEGKIFSGMNDQLNNMAIQNTERYMAKRTPSTSTLSPEMEPYVSRYTKLSEEPYVPYQEDDYIKWFNEQKAIMNPPVVKQDPRSILRSSSVIDMNDIRPIETPSGFQNRVFDNNMQLGQYKGVGHLSEPGYNYRVLSSEEIEAIRNSGGVFPRAGKQKGGNKNVKYWTKGNEKNWYGDQPTETIRVSETNFDPDKVVNSKHVEVYDKQTGKFKPLKQGGIIKDDMGQWAHPGEITEINSPYITMKGVPYPVLGISDTGDMQMMYPEEEYEFDGEKVTEYPMAKNGLRQEQKGLVNLDQLTNWSNYNTKQKGGWLDNL